MTYQMLDQLRDHYMESEGKWFSLRWHYIENCILKSYMDSYKQSGNEDFYLFVKSFIDRLYDENGSIPAIDVRYYSIDQIRPATILFDLYQRENDPKYKHVLDLIYEQLKTYPRTASGSFWHKENYPNQIWLDGLYMGQPFLVRYIKEFEEKKDYSDTIHQFLNVKKFIFNEENRLYYHAYDESREMFWCDKTTGMSPNVWGRAVGWLVMALVDVLELLEDEQVNSEPLNMMLQETLDGMLPYQHSGGMWYQIVDMGDRPGNYLESSGTLMLAYAMLKGSRLGYLATEYAERGKSAFDATVQQYLREEDGEVLLGGICRSAGLGTNPDTGKVRDGTFKYYTENEIIVSNNGHGVAPLIMAYTEVKLSEL
ncbi:Unsaturated rhamnogalacturonyl hydrolase YteR [Paenibacillus allorhizoplanae]|uniref:Unsaturated rhamnogalacturonyl hydrolase YteR n=1 Tax=Paenibacillus allorhizoplanae TaxID=2905648 RepID=A0ABM9C1Y0_9BACL|nr:glycoside hydrolase family 88 protein [Paenibacillus allorhizoplanae]CAH1200231.1 Unsaturated rhamnogalacturonyl hydrolase YteR [Paenibacillus allorhizoplanae]